MSENQTWQEQLQQRASDLVASRIGNFAEELQNVQNALNQLCQRIPAASSAVTSEEASGLQQHFEQARTSAAQDVESSFQARLEDAVAHARTETAAQYEGQITTLKAELAEAESSVSGMVAAGVTGAALGGAAASPATSISLKAAISDIDSQRQQADVLATLVRHSAQFASKVVFFVIKSGNAIGWKASGFANGLNDETARSLNVAIPVNALFNETVSSLKTSQVAGGQSGVLGSFSSDSHAVAIPLVIRGKAAAILYSESGDQNDLNLDALESLMQVTSMAIELLPARRNQSALSAAAPAPAPQPEAPTASVQSEVAPAPAPKPVPAAVVTPLGTTPAYEVKQVQVEAEIVPEAKPAAATASATQSDDEVRAHNDARRFARLLVSEIKLYNEQKVMEGRRSHDLYERLKEDIDRSRQMYEKRVSSAVSGKFDYFYDELLHTLGEGDTAKLGSGCPGPTVPVS